MVDGDVCVVAKAEGEFAGECGVKLDAVQASATRCEQAGDGSVAGTDFYDCALGNIAERIRDAHAGVFVDEEVLAEFGFLRHKYRG